MTNGMLPAMATSAHDARIRVRRRNHTLIMTVYHMISARDDVNGVAGNVAFSEKNQLVTIDGLQVERAPIILRFRETTAIQRELRAHRCQRDIDVHGFIRIDDDIRLNYAQLICGHAIPVRVLVDAVVGAVNQHDVVVVIIGVAELDHRSGRLIPEQQITALIGTSSGMARRPAGNRHRPDSPVHRY